MIRVGKFFDSALSLSSSLFTKQRAAHRKTQEIYPVKLRAYIECDYAQ